MVSVHQSLLCDYICLGDRHRTSVHFRPTAQPHVAIGLESSDDQHRLFVDALRAVHIDYFREYLVSAVCPRRC